MGKCAECHEYKVTAAYHHLCTGCANKKEVCPKCLQHKDIWGALHVPELPITHRGKNASFLAADSLLTVTSLSASYSPPLPQEKRKRRRSGSSGSWSCSEERAARSQACLSASAELRFEPSNEKWRERTALLLAAALLLAGLAAQGMRMLTMTAMLMSVETPMAPMMRATMMMQRLRLQDLHGEQLAALVQAAAMMMRMRMVQMTMMTLLPLGALAPPLLPPLLLHQVQRLQLQKAQRALQGHRGRQQLDLQALQMALPRPVAKPLIRGTLLSLLPCATAMQSTRYCRKRLLTRGARWSACNGLLKKPAIRSCWLPGAARHNAPTGMAANVDSCSLSFAGM